jgi:hypothetical protein
MCGVSRARRLRSSPSPPPPSLHFAPVSDSVPLRPVFVTADGASRSIKSPCSVRSRRSALPALRHVSTCARVFDWLCLRNALANTVSCPAGRSRPSSSGPADVTTAAPPLRARCFFKLAPLRVIALTRNVVLSRRAAPPLSVFPHPRCSVSPCRLTRLGQAHGAVCPRCSLLLPISSYRRLLQSFPRRGLRPTFSSLPFYPASHPLVPLTCCVCAQRTPPRSNELVPALRLARRCVLLSQC